MTEHPILFNEPMVRAILSGSKTQTRRRIKSQPSADTAGIAHGLGKQKWQWWSPIKEDWIRGKLKDKDAVWASPPFRCPFGAPGDRLWVRETWGSSMLTPLPGTIYYRADGRVLVERWRPSIHMPRGASRITLEVLDVRVQRLQDISEEDARAEGVVQGPTGKFEGAEQPLRGPFKSMTMAICHDTAREAFKDLWSATYGAESWAANPWTWAITFRRLDD